MPQLHTISLREIKTRFSSLHAVLIIIIQLEARAIEVPLSSVTATSFAFLFLIHFWLSAPVGLVS